MQQTNSQDHLPESGTPLASQANRQGVAARVADPAVQRSLAVDLTLIDPYDPLRTDLEFASVNSAKQHDATTFDRSRSGPGLGKILRRVLLDESHDIRRFPQGQECVSDCRLVTCAKASAGKRFGPSGPKRGQALLPWAFAEAAVRFLRDNPAAPQYLARLEKQHGKGKALTILAPTWARAVYDMRQRAPACDRHKFLAG